MRAGSAWGGKGISIANVDNDEGTINIFIFSARETELSHGSLIEIDFQRSDDDSDSDDDSVFPLIDINRLRLNNTEVSFSDSEPTESDKEVSDATPKLSFQFKIAAEDESAIIADRPDESPVDLLAKADETSEPKDEQRNPPQTDLPAVFEDRLSDDSRSESIEDYIPFPGDVCKPLKIADGHVDLAVNQWASSGSA